MATKTNARRGAEKRGKRNRKKAESVLLFSELSFDDGEFDFDFDDEFDFDETNMEIYTPRIDARRAIEMRFEQMQLRKDLLDFEDYDEYDEYIN